MALIWVELEVPSPYGINRIMTYRLDDGTVGMLKGSALKKAQRIIDMYNYNSGIRHFSLTHLLTI